MREFNILGFIAHMAGVVAEMEHAHHVALERAAKIVEKEAKDVIGTYRYGWPPLAEATLKRKSDDTPLLESGKLRDSIHHSVDHERARVGSDEDTAVWQELGTSRIPPRSFLAEAAKHKTDDVLNEIGRVVTHHLTGEKVDVLGG
jgi:phage gpG-like protein